MTRLFHGEGSGVFGDNTEEVDRIWKVAVEDDAPIECREVHDVSHVIDSATTRKNATRLRKMGFEPFVRVESSTQAIEVAHGMNQAGSSNLFVAIRGVLNIVDAVLK